MKTKVRDFIRLEISRLPKVNNKSLSIADFDQIYHLFEQMVGVETGNKELDGLGEQLGISLERIICNKIDRADINVLFPNVWGNYEPFIKKLVFFADKNQYQVMENNNETLESYLNFLGIISSERIPGNRTPEIQCFHYAKQARNDKSHTCPLLSVRECYEKLDYCLAAMVLATEKAYPMLNRNSSSLANQHGIDMTTISPVIITKPTLFEAGPALLAVLRLSDFQQDIREISHIGDEYEYHWFFNQNGRLIRDTGEQKNYQNENTYTYNREGNQEERIRHCKSNGVPYIDSEYTYNDIGALETIKKYDMKNGSRALSVSLYIEYTSDGKVEIKLGKKEGEEGTILHFNNQGLLVGSFIPGLYGSYIYNGGKLTSLDRGDRTKLEIETLGNTLLFVDKEKKEDGSLVQSWEMENGRVSRVTYYQENGKVRWKLMFSYY